MKRMLVGFSFLLTLWTCTSGSNGNDPQEQIYKVLCLGDSYTFGTGVCETCSFPKQLRDSLTETLSNSTIDLTVIAETSWTTSDLLNGLDTAAISNDQDLVTLLIGVNNQFQGLPFQVFTEDFDNLVTQSIELANYNRENLLIISIFDYANTEFGQIFGGPVITDEITFYNDYIASYCLSNNLRYIDMQNLIIEGLVRPELIAEDGLHPSTLAYSNLVAELLPEAMAILQN